MADRRPPSYPPVGDDARYDRIVARGRSLKRRRQLAGVAGAGGALAVVALVAAVAVSLGSDPSSGEDGSFAEAPSTTVTTTVPEVFTIEPLDVSPLQIVVTDPEQPLGEGSEQCLGVVVYESEAAAVDGAFASHEGWDCGLGDGGAAAVDLRVTEIDPTAPDLGGANVGPCGVTISNSEPETAGTALGETTFTLTALPPGSYWVELTAWSGIGDGCGDEQAPYERENIESLSTSITVG